MHTLDWSDLRYVLAVANEGSAAAAARALHVNHSTVVRRVRSFEEQLDIRIFDHLPSGYRLTTRGEIFLDAARSIDGVVSELGRKMVAGEDGLAGSVRLTTTDSLFPLLVDGLYEFRQAYPRFALDVVITNVQLNLDVLDAEVALRPTVEPPGGLVGRRICDLAFAVYAARAPARDAPAADLPWLGLGPPLTASSVGRWLGQSALTGTAALSCNSFVSLQAMAERGLGRVVLPCWMGDASDLLERVTPEPLPFLTHLWVLYHRDVRRSRRVKAVAEFLVETVREKRAALEGRDEP
jgi:DNA-binding transcriptional LysR family regulator